MSQKIFCTKLAVAVIVFIFSDSIQDGKNGKYNKPWSWITHQMNHSQLKIGQEFFLLLHSQEHPLSKFIYFVCLMFLEDQLQYMESNMSKAGGVKIWVMLGLKVGNLNSTPPMEVQINLQLSIRRSIIIIISISNNQECICHYCGRGRFVLDLQLHLGTQGVTFVPLYHRNQFLLELLDMVVELGHYLELLIPIIQTQF